MKTSTFIKVKTSTPGMHHWPNAPEHRAYLAQPHRHLFLVECSLQVRADDREVEFHDLKYVLDEALPHVGEQKPGYIDFGGRSCESIARELLGRVRTVFGDRPIVIEVSEDGECAATIFAN